MKEEFAIPVPKRYTAKTIRLTPDRFMGMNGYEVTGYYIKHLNATPQPLGPMPEGWYEQHTEHYIASDSFSDWGMARELDLHLIDISTLREAK